MTAATLTVDPMRGVGGVHSSPVQRKRSGKPRLGFLGVGWIGRHRMEAIAQANLADIVGIADAVEENAAAASELAPDTERLPDLESLLQLDLDGIVIATPSALHAAQSIAALEQGLSVFCQKPLARTKDETTQVIEAARRNNQLLAVDLSYRFTSGIRELRRVVQSGELGRIYSVDLVFHNAYGPDKSWFYDFKLAGGGCVMDLGIHLVDLALWILDYPQIEHTTARLFHQGIALQSPIAQVEDFATVRLDLETGASVQINCSWKLQAGCDAIIGATFYGTNGGVAFHNVNGSFYEFQAERFYGTRREIISSGTEDWGGRAAIDWLKRLSQGTKYDPAMEGMIEVAGALDRIYGRA